MQPDFNLNSGLRQTLITPTGVYAPVKKKWLKKPMSFLGLFNQWTWILLVLFAFLQCLFFSSAENLFGVACTVAGWRLTQLIILKKKKLQRYTFSSFIIIGYSFTQYWMPTVFTLIEGKPLVHNLEMPYEIFTHSILALIVLLLAHGLHCYFNRQSGSRAFNGVQKLLIRSSFFKPPTNRQIWVIGIIGLTAMFVSYFFIKQSYANLSEGAGNKFIEGLMPFAFAPFFLLLKKLYTSDSETEKAITFKIILFTLCFFVVGIAGNSRGIFMTAIVSTALGYFLGLLMGKFSYRVFTMKNTVIAALGIWLITGPLADIGTAMVIVRSQRGSISKMEMLEQTMDVYKDKTAIKFYKAAERGQISDWDEQYFDNIFLARFCNLKFNDASLLQAKKLKGVDPKMTKVSIDKFWATLPKPILDALSITVNKDEVNASSFGDFLYDRAGGADALEGFRTGQFAGTGMASFGWWYLLILFIGIGPVFFLMDLFVINPGTPRLHPSATYLSLAGLLSITSVFMFLSLSSMSESVVNLFIFMFRTWIQNVIIYMILFFIARMISQQFKRKRVRQRVSLQA